MPPAPDYLNPQIPAGLQQREIPLIEATAESLAGYGWLVDDPASVDIEIVRWPAQGWRAVDEDSGRDAGTTAGIFISEWDGDILYGRNQAVGGHYILGYAKEPHAARRGHGVPPEALLLWHANYHPDGGQLFFPKQHKPFLVPLALPGDDVSPANFVCFWFTGAQGLYLHPSVWHDGVFALEGRQEFFDRQGAVHARVSVDFPREFNCLLRVALAPVRAMPADAQPRA